MSVDSEPERMCVDGYGYRRSENKRKDPSNNPSNLVKELDINGTSAESTYALKGTR